MSKWLILVLLNITIGFWLYYFDVAQWVFSIDSTYITTAIVSVYTISLMYIGYIKYDGFIRDYEELWFVSDQLLGLGMLGTVIGFMIMLNTNFIGVSISDAQSVTKLIQTMTSSMGIALITTAVGLICSMLLKVQIVILNR